MPEILSESFHDILRDILDLKVTDPMELIKYKFMESNKAQEDEINQFERSMLSNNPYTETVKYKCKNGYSMRLSVSTGKDICSESGSKIALSEAIVRSNYGPTLLYSFTSMQKR